MNTDLSTALASILKLDAGDLATLVMTAQALLDNGKQGAVPVPVGDPSYIDPARAPAQPQRAMPCAVPSWIHLTDHGLPKIDPSLFQSQAFLRRWEPAKLANIYAASSDGTRDISDQLGQPCYKPGVTVRPDIAERLAEHARRRYGAHHQQVDGGFIEDAGFGRWEAASLSLSRARPKGSPVTAAGKVLQTKISSGILLDKALRDELRPYGLAAYMASHQGRQACAARSLDPRKFGRFTARKRDGAMVYEPAVELTIMRPRMDADRLADIIEGIVAVHVMAQPR